MYKWVNDTNKNSNDYGISDFVDLIKNSTPCECVGYVDKIEKYTIETEAWSQEDKALKERQDKTYFMACEYMAKTELYNRSLTCRRKPR